MVERSDLPLRTAGSQDKSKTLVNTQLVSFGLRNFDDKEDNDNDDKTYLYQFSFSTSNYLNETHIEYTTVILGQNI